MAENSSALLMRAIGEELAQRLMPELTSADARERATLARLVLEQLAAGPGRVGRTVRARILGGIPRAIQAALDALPSERFGRDREVWRGELLAIAPERGVGAQRENRIVARIGCGDRAPRIGRRDRHRPRGHPRDIERGLARSSVAHGLRGGPTEKNRANAPRQTLRPANRHRGGSRPGAQPRPR